MRTRSTSFSTITIVGLVILALLLPTLLGAVFDIDDRGSLMKLATTVRGVVVAVGAFFALWVLANLAVDQATSRWRRFQIAGGAGVGFVVLAAIHGNRALRPLVPADASLPDGWIDTAIRFLSWPLVGAVIGAVLVAVLTALPANMRVVAGAVLGAGAAAFIGFSLDSIGRPTIETGPLLISAVAGLVAGCAWALARRSTLWRCALVGLALGWVVGAFGFGDIGTGLAARTNGLVATLVPGLALGAAIGGFHDRTSSDRQRFDHKARAILFLGPALFCVMVALIIPTIRTIYLSVLDRDSEEFVGLDNYRTVFTDKDAFNLSNWSNIFTSQLFYLGVVLMGAGLLLGIVLGRRRGYAFERSGGSLTPLALGAFLLMFAVFTSLRGTIFNNLWWVFGVTILSTGLGLAIAVLSDGVRFEKAAKSLIFMPMAISFVGAAIIWRFMYIARDTRKPQTGVINALWVELGRLSNSGWPRALALTLLAVILLALLGLALHAWRSQAGSVVAGSLMTALPFAWLLYRLAGPGLGGFSIDDDGEVRAETVLFLQEQPFNTFFLMIILIWIQTGFAMVILSAAIKAVPSELIEAARVDGATNSQIFWRVTLPQIVPTIGVVTTTIMVLVMKVFDIVKVTTNGQFGSQVLANDMFDKAFSKFNTGLGAALAAILFFSVVPIMFFNVRRMQQAEV